MRIRATRSERSDETSENVRRRAPVRLLPRDLTLPPGVDSKAVMGGHEHGIIEVRNRWPAGQTPQTEKMPTSRD